MANYILQSTGLELGRFGQIKMNFFVMFIGSEPMPGKPSKKPIRLNVTRNQYLSYRYSFVPFIQLDFNIGSQDEWRKDQTISIPGYHIGSLLHFLKKTLRLIEDPENKIFYYDKDKNDALSIYGEYNTGKILIKKVVGSHIAGSLPTIVVDYQERLYEGATIIFDKRERSADIAHDELENLVYVLDHTDFYGMAVGLFNSITPWGDKNVTKLLDVGIWQDSMTQEKKDLRAYSMSQRQPTNSGVKTIFGELKEKTQNG